jgi:murein DD-endopeptidase MepM/ murein hydrolase activator NlpD
MNCWPVPNSYSKKIPLNGNPGSFWEYRGDRFHTGIDIYAPEGSKVLSVDEGKVIETGEFTSPKIIPYWNKTYYILIKNKNGLFYKYAELSDIVVTKETIVKTDELIGHIGLVLNTDQITLRSPQYIQRLNNHNKHSMLHFEVYSSMPKQTKKYLGGNWLGSQKPKNLLDPTNLFI